MTSPFEFLNKNGYHHHFCACFAAPLKCLLAFFLPCILVGKVKATLDKKDFDIPSCICWHFSILRNRLLIQDLHKSELKEDSNSSVFAVALFPCCALVQDAHEVAFRKDNGNLVFTRTVDATSMRAPEPIEPPREKPATEENV